MADGHSAAGTGSATTEAAPTQLAQAQGDPIGVATVVEGGVSVIRADGSTETLSAGAPLYEGDEISTDDGGRLGIEFVDESQFSLGASGTVRLDEMLYEQGDAGGSSEVISVIEGAFAFVSGEIAKTGDDAMTVNTPVATIGVRGTTVAGTVGPDGELSVTLLPDQGGTLGEIAVFNDGGMRILHDNYQNTVVGSRESAPRAPRTITEDDANSQYGNAVQSLPERASGANGGGTDNPDTAPDGSGADTDGAVDETDVTHLLERPAEGEIAVLEAALGENFQLGFDLDDALVEQLNDLMIFRFEDGAEIRIAMEGAGATGITSSVLLADGTFVSIGDVMALSGAGNLAEELNEIASAAGGEAVSVSGTLSQSLDLADLSSGSSTLGALANETAIAGEPNTVLDDDDDADGTADAAADLAATAGSLVNGAVAGALNLALSTDNGDDANNEEANANTSDGDDEDAADGDGGSVIDFGATTVDAINSAALDGLDINLGDDREDDAAGDDDGDTDSNSNSNSDSNTGGENHGGLLEEVLEPVLTTNPNLDVGFDALGSDDDDDDDADDAAGDDGLDDALEVELDIGLVGFDLASDNDEQTDGDGDDTGDSGDSGEDGNLNVAQLVDEGVDALGEQLNTILGGGEDAAGTEGGEANSDPGESGDSDDANNATNGDNGNNGNEGNEGLALGLGVGGGLGLGLSIGGDNDDDTNSLF